MGHAFNVHVLFSLVMSCLVFLKVEDSLGDLGDLGLKACANIQQGC